MSQFGKAFKINLSSGTGAWTPLGGIAKPCRIEAVARHILEAGTGQRKAVVLDVSEIRYAIPATIKVQRFQPYLTGYAIKSGEGALPAHKIHWTDGKDIKQLDGCKVGRCFFRVRHGGDLICDLTIVGKTLSDLTPEPTWQTYPEKALTYKNISSFKINTTAITNWKAIEWGVDNHVVEESLGVEPKPSEVEETLAEYSVACVISRKDASQLASVGTAKAIEIKVTDNQSPAVTTTFTYSKALITLSRIEIPGLELELERLEFKPETLTIS